MERDKEKIAYSIGNGINAIHYLGIGYNEMIIEGQKAEHIGFVSFWSPWAADEYDIIDDLWGTPDGKRYVERNMFQDIVRYNWIKHGYIWTDKEIHKASMGLPVTTKEKPHYFLKPEPQKEDLLFNDDFDDEDLFEDLLFDNAFDSEDLFEEY